MPGGAAMGESLFQRVWRLSVRDTVAQLREDLVRRMVDAADCPRPTLLLLTNRTKRCYRVYVAARRFSDNAQTPARLEVDRRATHKGRRVWKTAGKKSSWFGCSVINLADIVLRTRDDDLLAVMVGRDGRVRHEQWLRVKGDSYIGFMQRVHTAFNSMGVPNLR